MLKEYKENPQVSIVVQQVNSYAIYVMGEIARPGKFPLKSKTTLLQAITLAGGFTPNAARNKLVVFRFGDKGQKDIKIKASYDDIILRDSSPQNIELKPGDTIVVPSETMVLVHYGTLARENVFIGWCDRHSWSGVLVGLFGLAEGSDGAGEQASA